MDVKEKLAELLTEFYGCDPMYYDVDALAMAQHLIDHGVTVQSERMVDAVPVVRCKDCKYFKTRLCENDDAPVRHGRWRTNVLYGYEYTFVCSECGYVDVYPFDGRHRYCPNCGAKMDEKE